MNINLVIEADDSWTGPTEVLAGRKWRISSNHTTTTASYHCVSYTWGPVKAPNLFSIGGNNVSSMTRGALEAAIASTMMPSSSSSPSATNTTVHAFWIDAVCVPRSGPSRRATLESMGNIYSHSQSTIIVLQTATWAIINRDRRPKKEEPYTEAELAVLNEDKWINSVWTYQELVNAPKVTFTALRLPPPASADRTPPDSKSIQGEDFLNTLGTSLMYYRKRDNLSALTSRLRWPGLEALEDAVLDWQIAGYMERSMLACLTGISGRYCDPARPTNRLYALLGALTREPSWDDGEEEGQAETVEGLVEKVMRVCEEKGDFSVLFTGDARRRDGEGRRWRPDAERGLGLGLEPIVAWHCWGERQEGEIRGSGDLELRNMVRLDLQREPSSEAVSGSLGWLRDFADLDAGSGSNDEEALRILEQELPRALRGIGFRGASVCHRCSTGIVLTQEEIKPDECIVEACASGSIRWAFGAPGMAKVSTRAGGDKMRYMAIVHVSPLLSRAEKQSTLLDS